MSKINKSFSYSKDWNDSLDFPTTEYSEKRVRADIQLLFDEVKSFINDKILGAVNDNAAKLAAAGAGGEVTHDLLGNDSVGTNNIQDGSLTEEKYADDSIPGTAYQDGSITPDKFDEEEVTEFIENLCERKIVDMLGTSETAIGLIVGLVNDNSSRLRFLKGGSHTLCNKGYSSQRSKVFSGFAFSDLGIPENTDPADIIVRMWAEPGTEGYNPISFSTRAEDFMSAYSVDTESNEVWYYMANNSSSTGESNITGRYAIFLLEE